jgi:hypothetical protein
MTAGMSAPKGLGLQEVVCWWLRQQPDLQKEAREIAWGDDDYLYGDDELAAAVTRWLFTTTDDEYLVNELGMSPTLRNVTRASMTRSQFDLIDWAKVREELLKDWRPGT